MESQEKELKKRLTIAKGGEEAKPKKNAIFTLLINEDV